MASGEGEQFHGARPEPGIAGQDNASFQVGEEDSRKMASISFVVGGMITASSGDGFLKSGWG